MRARVAHGRGSALGRHRRLRRQPTSVSSRIRTRAGPRQDAGRRGGHQPSVSEQVRVRLQGGWHVRCHAALRLIGRDPDWRRGLTHLDLIAFSGVDVLDVDHSSASSETERVTPRTAGRRCDGLPGDAAREHRGEAPQTLGNECHDRPGHVVGDLCRPARTERLLGRDAPVHDARLEDRQAGCGAQGIPARDDAFRQADASRVTSTNSARRPGSVYPRATFRTPLPPFAYHSRFVTGGTSTAGWTAYRARPGTRRRRRRRPRRRR